MLTVILSAPALVKVMGALAVVIVLNSLLHKLLPALVAATLVLALWCGHPLLPGKSSKGIIQIATAELFSPDLLLLLAIVALIVFLSSQMSAAGVMHDLVGAVRARLSPRAAIAALPALIGALPMPGGALFSAPLVDKCDEGNELQPVLKAQVNYWFRHVWEYWWPLYPGLLLALDLTGLEVWQVMLLHFPMALLAAAGGYFFILRKINTPTEVRPADLQKPPLLPLVAPVLVVVATYLLMRVFFGAMSSYFPGTLAPHKYLPMLTGVLLAILLVQIQRPLTKEKWARIVFSGKTAGLLLLVIMVRIFGAFVDADLPDGASLPEHMRQELANWHIPITAIIVILPFVGGMSTGLAVGFVGASFPVVLNLIGDNPPLKVLLATTVLAYGAGYVGMMLSPVHICLIVTNEHFRTRLLHSLRGIVAPALLVLVGAVAMHVLILYW